MTPCEARSRPTCGGWKCQFAYRNAQEGLRRKQHEQLLQQYERSLAQATTLREASARSHGVEDPPSYRVIVLPVNERPLAPLTRKRRYRFVKRLMRLTEETLREPALQPLGDAGADTDQALPILKAACAICRGKCCVRGGTRAYLNGNAIRRFLSGHPDATARDIVEAYYRCLPVETYQNSCVFHSEAGCRLPTSLRSATCLNTVCGGVIELRQRIELDGEAKFFLAAANNERIVRSAFEIHETPASRGERQFFPKTISPGV